MIVTLTMNPAVDKSTSIEAMIPEKKLRCKEVLIEAGGGGINVSKAIKKLGGESLAIFPSGGTFGNMLEGFIETLGINYKAIHIDSEIRESFTVNEERTGAQYRFVLPGAPLTANDVENCISAIHDIQPSPKYLVASGSLPPGVGDDFFRRLAMECKKMGARFIIDSSGKPLKLAVQEGVYLLKPNLSELCFLVDKEHLELSEVDDAAKSIIDQGNCEVIVVSLGPSGALLVTKDLCKHIAAPTVKKQTTVGAGDSMVGGMVYKLAQGADLVDTVRFGIACGTAATMNKGTQLFKPEDVDKLYHWMKR